MLQRLAVTNPKNDKMDPHGVNPTLSIFLPAPFPVAMQGLGATAPWEKDLRIPCLEIIVFTNLKTGIAEPQFSRACSFREVLDNVELIYQISENSKDWMQKNDRTN